MIKSEIYYNNLFNDIVDDNDDEEKLNNNTNKYLNNIEVGIKNLDSEFSEDKKLIVKGSNVYYTGLIFSFFVLFIILSILSFIVIYTSKQNKIIKFF